MNNENGKVSVGGITFNASQLVKSVYDKFEGYLEDTDNAFFISKREFEHDEEELKFKYRYAIEVETDCEGMFYYSLLLVPSFGSLCGEYQKKVLDSCEYDTPYDVSGYGCNVCMLCEKAEGEEWDEEIVRAIASVFESVDGLRGFYLDKRVNMIGTMGWDLLDSFINGSDWNKVSLERLKCE